MAMVASGTAPDVININTPLALALDGQLVDLTAKMDDLGYFDKKSLDFTRMSTICSQQMEKAIKVKNFTRRRLGQLGTTIYNAT